MNVLEGAQELLEAANLLFFVFMLVGAPVFSAYVVLFNRRFATESLEWRKRVFKWGYGQTERNAYRVIAVVVGLFLFFGSLMNSAEYLIPWAIDTQP